jgi:transcriptional regulator with XRE-family HTH domain
MRKRIEVRKSGKNRKLAGIELDLTQTQLAQRINSKQKSISRYETGASLPSIRTLVKIAQVLKKPAGYFLD